jgi:hypothetical protein
MAEREPGFYWVRCRRFPSGEGDWQVAQYVVGLWHCAGSGDELTDDELAEIGDRVERSALYLSLVDYDILAPTKYLRFPSVEEWPEPQPITDARKTGERLLVWNDSQHPDTRGWFTAFYDGKIDGWLTGALGGYTELDRVVAVYLPLPPPPDVKP